MGLLGSGAVSADALWRTSWNSRRSHPHTPLGHQPPRTLVSNDTPSGIPTTATDNQTARVGPTGARANSDPLDTGPPVDHESQDNPKVPTQLSSYVLPTHQRRTVEELTEDLDLTAGDSTAKRSAFWALLVLSSIIAAAGLLSDSTAAVIGAMIIAPLSTPIMGIALGIAKRTPGGVRSAGRFVLFGGLTVVLIGVLFAVGLPGSFDLLGNDQIASRTSPGILNLVAAIATGFAGSVALARRDVAAVLPGVAIAISLVPPLVVTGICLGQRSFALAAGALILFLSNFLALVLAGTLVFAVLVLKSMEGETDRSRRKAVIALSLLLVVITVPLATNTIGNYLVTLWDQRITQAADAWITAVPGASVEEVKFVSHRAFVRVQTPGDLPPVQDLLMMLDGQVPKGIPVVVTTSLGQNIEVGVVGGGG